MEPKTNDHFPTSVARWGIIFVLMAAALAGCVCHEKSQRDGARVAPPPAVSAPGVEKPTVPPVAAVAALPVVAVPPAVVAVATNSLTITGRVRLRGTPPPEKEIPIDPVCAQVRGGRPLTTRFFVCGTDAGLADVFVHLRGGVAGQKYPPPAKPVEIKTIGCEFQPYVTAAQTGQSVVVRNLDSMFHNIHATPSAPGSREISKAQIPKGPEVKFVFYQPELFLRFKCDVHPWMFAYVNVIEHPFFGMTDTNGVFHMPLPPPGRYEIEAVHRRAGKSVQTIEVEAGKELKLDFTMDVSP